MTPFLTWVPEIDLQIFSFLRGKTLESMMGSCKYTFSLIANENQLWYESIREDLPIKFSYRPRINYREQWIRLNYGDPASVGTYPCKKDLMNVLLRHPPNILTRAVTLDLGKASLKIVKRLVSQSKAPMRIYGDLFVATRFGRTDVVEYLYEEAFDEIKVRRLHRYHESTCHEFAECLVIQLWILTIVEYNRYDLWHHIESKKLLCGLWGHSDFCKGVGKIVSNRKMFGKVLGMVQGPEKKLLVVERVLATSKSTSLIQEALFVYFKVAESLRWSRKVSFKKIKKAVKKTQKWTDEWESLVHEVSECFDSPRPERALLFSGSESALEVC